LDGTGGWWWRSWRHYTLLPHTFPENSHTHYHTTFTTTHGYHHHTATHLCRAATPFYTTPHMLPRTTHTAYSTTTHHTHTRITHTCGYTRSPAHLHAVRARPHRGPTLHTHYSHTHAPLHTTTLFYAFAHGLPHHTPTPHTTIYTAPDRRLRATSYSLPLLH